MTPSQSKTSKKQNKYNTRLTHIKQESRVVAKVTVWSTLYMGALKIFRSAWLHPWLLFPKFFTCFCSDRFYECVYKIWSS